MGRYLIWAVAFFVMAIMDYAGQLKTVDAFAILFTAWIACKIFFPKSDEETKEEKSTDQTDNIEAIRKATADLRRQAEEYEKQQRFKQSANSHFKSNAKPRSAQTPSVPAKIVRLSPDSLKVVRNMLLRHHEMKRTDVSYQESQMSKDTNNIVQQLNDIIASNK